MKKVTLQTKEKKEVRDITSVVEDHVREQNTETGVVVVHVMHTTAAISVADLDPGTDQDMLDAFYAMVPSNDEIGYRHPHDPEHTPDHILATLIGSSVTVPVEQGKLLLGTWQRIALFEFDGPRERKIVVTNSPE